jgi:hypothetical protein
MIAGGLLASALLAVWTLVPGVVALYVVWTGLGLCMAATLYEPAFVIVARAYDDASRRLRALAAVTLFGGLASTLFLPLTAVLLSNAGWRGAVIALACAVVGSAAVTWMFAFRGWRAAAPAPPPSAARRTDHTIASGRFAFIAATFAIASLASAAFTANLLPALGERGISPARAAMLGGLIGVMQLPGRALLLHGAIGSSPARLLAASLILQGAGLGAVGLGSSLVVIAAGTMLFALGAGLTTLVRPHLVQTLYSRASGGVLNGRIARRQQLARAAGPLAVAWLAGLVGYAAVFVVIAGLFAAMTVASQPLLANDGPARNGPGPIADGH